jgi:hypothetical protein
MMPNGVLRVAMVKDIFQWIPFSLLAEAEPAEKLPGFIEEFLKNSPWGTTVGILAVCTIVLGWLAKQTETLQKLIEGWQKIVGSVRKESTQQTAESRKKLLKILKGEVARRRKGSLHNLVMMDLRFQEQPQQVGQAQLPELAPEPQVERTLQVGKQPNVILEPTRKIIDVFNQPEVQSKLLILGEPGAGKTTELLRLATDLIDQAEANEAAPIPVIFELSTWKDDRQPLDQWLTAQLKENYNVPKSVSEQWLKHEQLLPLLDGLDELGLNRQVKCVQAINQLLKETTYSHLIVCCRREEYEEGQVKLEELNGAVYLQPLTDVQIQKYLHDVNRLNLWQTIEREPDLKELAKSPLLLTMMVVAYQGRAIHNRQELFDAYIDQQFSQPLSKQTISSPKQPTRKQTLSYLSWLAKKLKTESTNEFLIEKLQSNWLDNIRVIRLYRLICATALGLILSFIFYLNIEFIFKFIFTLPKLFILPSDDPRIGGFNMVRVRKKLFDGFEQALLRGTYWTLPLVMVCSLILGTRFGRKSIEFTESLQIFRASKKKLKGWLVFGFSFGCLFAALISGIFILIARIYSPRLFVIHIEELGVVKKTVDVAIESMWIQGAVFLVIFWLLFWVFFGLSRGLQAEIQTRRIPNQGVWLSAKNASIFSFICSGVLIAIYLVSGNANKDVIASIYAVTISILIGILTGVAWGGFACIQHFVLRVLLWRSGSIPWDYARFLEYAVERRFMLRVGGRYRFLHDLLREHFAHMEV